MRAGHDAGLTATRMRGGDLLRPYPGARIPASAPPMTHRELCAAYLLRSPEGQFFSHVTAARLWRIPLPLRLEAERALDVGVVKPLPVPRLRGIRGHRLTGTGLTIVRRYGLPVADAASTWCQLGTVLDHDDLVAAGDHLVRCPRKQERGERRPYVRLDHLRSVALSRRGPGGRALREAAADVREGADSRRESLLRLLLVRAGLPEPELNQEIFDDRGHSLGFADMLYRTQRVVVEYDGDQHRTDYDQFEKDAVRLDDFRHRAHHHVVQVRKKGLSEHPQDTVARVREALARADPSSS
ncbi:hypothetical protein [Herbiconiux sp.]|uniref:hypothetical protein n=1 Tax=Herbiconiux sp. TaxID=1871186 RepID=UPI0025C54B1C|nr:hypothetical protein [Herbiconiux sp.]